MRRSKHLAAVKMIQFHVAIRENNRTSKEEILHPNKKRDGCERPKVA